MGPSPTYHPPEGEECETSVEHGLPLWAEPAVGYCSRRPRPSPMWGSRFVGARGVGPWVGEQKPLGKTPQRGNSRPESTYLPTCPPALSSLLLLCITPASSIGLFRCRTTAPSSSLLPCVSSASSTSLPPCISSVLFFALFPVLSPSLRAPLDQVLHTVVLHGLTQLNSEGARLNR